MKASSVKAKLTFTACLLLVGGMYAATVGRWSFTGTVGDSVPAGTSFANMVDAAKYPAVVTSRYGGTASSSHLSSIAGFDAAPFNYVRKTRNGEDVQLDTSLHLDGVEGGSQGCPLYIDDPDGDLELGTYTLELFVRLPTTADKTSTGNAMFFSKVYHDFGGETGVYYNGLVCASGSTWSYHYCCTSSGSPVDGSVTFGTRAISDGQWHHIALQVNGANNTTTLYIDHAIVGSAQTLPGPLAYGYDNGGTPERTPWVIGNHQTLDGYSWSGDIGTARLSDAALDDQKWGSNSISKLCNQMMWQGSSIAVGETIMHLSFDGNFDALNWSRLQTTNGTFEAGVQTALGNGVASFATLKKSVRQLVDGNGNILRKENKGCLVLNGGCISLSLAQFHPDIYDSITAEIFFKAKSADVSKSWDTNPVYFFKAGQFGTRVYGEKIKSVQFPPLGKSNNVVSDITPYNDEWHHIAVVVRRPDSAHQVLDVYYDYDSGSKVSSGQVLGVITLGPDDVLQFGAPDNGYSKLVIDEFRISRGALPISSFMRQAEYHVGSQFIFR